ncbi:MAG: hypothetical protein OHK0038_05810 [Flammeovirgaceae bacterium]
MYKLLLFNLILIFAACNIKQSDNVNVDIVKQEISNAKIKRLTDAQIVQEAYEKGKMIADTLMPILKKQQQLCGFQDFSSLNNQQKSLILKISLECQMPSNVSDKEKQVWESYLYGIQENIPLKDNIQKLEEDQILYTYPFLQESAQDPTQKLAVLKILLSKKEVIRQADMKKILNK